MTNTAKRHRKAKTASPAQSADTALKPYRVARKFTVTGATAPSGEPWVQVTAGGRIAWIPLRDFAGTTAARDKLKAKRIILFKEEWDACLSLVESLKRFPVQPLIERPGWSDPHFALVSGEVVSPPDSPVPIVLFEKAPEKLARSGSLEGWRNGLEPVIAEQTIATFVLMLGFAAALLPLTERVSNFGFEIAGPKGIGKSTLQQLLASVYGPAVRPHGRNYWVTANATANALEELMFEHSDMTMVVEEANLFAAGESEKARAGKFDELVFRLANGSVKARHGKPQSDRTRFIYVTSTNEPLMTVLAGYRQEVATAASDRLLTLLIATDRPYGVFDKLADGFDSSSALASEIASIIAGNFGEAFPAFIRKLVNARARDESSLRARISGYMTEFRDRIGIDLNSGSQVRVADAFGIAYAAGRLARAYGVLPKSARCRAAAEACYRLCQEGLYQETSFIDRLEALSANPRSVSINGADLRPSDQVDPLVPAFYKTRHNGSIEVIFTEMQLSRMFPDRRKLLGDPDILALIQRDADRRKTVKRKLYSDEPPQRVYCFKLLPPLPEEQ